MVSLLIYMHCFHRSARGCIWSPGKLCTWIFLRALLSKGREGWAGAQAPCRRSVGHPARAWRQAGIVVQAEHLLGQLLLSAPPVGCAVPALNGILQGLCAVEQFRVAELQLSGGACSTAVLHTWPRRGSVHRCNTLLAPQPASCARCLQPELMAALLYFCCLLLIWTASTSSGPACPLGLGSHEQSKMPRGHFRLITKMLPCDCLQ